MSGIAAGVSNALLQHAFLAAFGISQLATRLIGPEMTNNQLEANNKLDADSSVPVLFCCWLWLA